MAVDISLLKFESETCKINREQYEQTVIIRYKNVYEYSVFQDQTCYNGIYTLKVIGNTIYLYCKNGESKNISFSNRWIKYKTSQTLSQKEEKLDWVQSEETFDYQRTLDEIVLVNDSKKWVGVLNTDDWTITFSQIVPEKKELPVFHLR